MACFKDGETWRKVFGPIFVYLNSTPNVSKAYNLWLDAKKQVITTVKSEALERKYRVIDFDIFHIDSIDNL